MFLENLNTYLYGTYTMIDTKLPKIYNVVIVPVKYKFSL